MSEDPLVHCPSCQEDGLQKLVSAASFRLKGGGWYETDFKKGNKKHLADSGDSAPASKSESGNDAAKQQPKAESKTGGDKKAAATSGQTGTTSKQ
jgi:predicted nucleic acid-binding Zn ribbon protein